MKPLHMLVAALVIVLVPLFYLIGNPLRSFGDREPVSFRGQAVRVLEANQGEERQIGASLGANFRRDGHEAGRRRQREEEPGAQESETWNAPEREGREGRITPAQ